METVIQEKYERLKKIISDASSAAVAFSGGVDSTFLFKVCVDLPGVRVLAVTATSDTYPARELAEARKLARQIGGDHMIIESEELDVPGFSDNPPHRCFLCKTELFSRVTQIAGQQGLRWVFDGSNADDCKDFRPGRDAARKLGVRSPLEEAGLGKDEIRQLSKMLRLSTWDKPALACLSSRFPYYTKITRPALKQVEAAENFLFRLGIKVFRVRHHDLIARIETGKAELQILLESNVKDQVVAYFKSLGYKYVTLDLEGYRTGSMNETLTDDQLSK
ncbi:MAG: ATP-dependent sacrificial sulfur transferase LarE [Desulfobacterales bacterium]|nr:ATP-dependent sacrificial sulfur transferase LarE [Desulfobacterales bacterium]